MWLYFEKSVWDITFISVKRLEVWSVLICSQLEILSDVNSFDALLVRWLILNKQTIVCFASNPLCCIIFEIMLGKFQSILRWLTFQLLRSIYLLIRMVNPTFVVWARLPNKPNMGGQNSLMSLVLCHLT